MRRGTILLAFAVLVVLGVVSTSRLNDACPGGSADLLLSEAEVRSAPALRTYRAVEDPLGGLFDVASDPDGLAGTVPGLCGGAEQVFVDEDRGWLSINVLTMDTSERATSFVDGLTDRWPGSPVITAPPGVTALEVPTTAGPTIVSAFVSETHAVVIGVFGHDVSFLDAQARQVVARVRDR